ncbi:MAG: acyltransferase family protein, partial [Planctomycetota bacterium]
MKEGQADSRRHDLDALRAFAMLLGIVLHGAMSFIPGIRLVWGVEDSQANPFYGLLLAMIHGWRMPLFFLISGFFTAMLWKKRGLRSLISHRFKRIFLPLLLSMLTIVPALLIVSTFVRSRPSTVALEADSTETGDGGASEQIDVWKAVAVEDIDTIRRYVEAKGDLESKDPFGSTPLHIACFFGRAEAANVLVDAGASLDSRNNDGARPQDLLSIDWGTTSMIARAVGLPLDR